jgi:hypothetical protein
MLEIVVALARAAERFELEPAGDDGAIRARPAARPRAATPA